jgi:hypothetical protein
VWTLSTVLIVTLGVTIYNRMRPKPVGWNPRIEAIAGLSKESHDQVLSLKRRFETEQLSEDDWRELERNLFGKAPVGRTLAFSCLFKLKEPENQRRALALVLRDANQTPRDEPLHDLAPTVVEGIATDGFMYRDSSGCMVVKNWSQTLSDPRLQKAAAEAVDLCTNGPKRKIGESKS